MKGFELFNLADDPEELNNRAGDPECREIQEALMAKVLDGWDPEWVAEKMVEKRKDLEIIRGWAKETDAPEQFRWPQTSEMTYVD